MPTGVRSTHQNTSDPEAGVIRKSSETVDSFMCLEGCSLWCDVKTEVTSTTVSRKIHLMQELNVSENKGTAVSTFS